MLEEYLQCDPIFFKQEIRKTATRQYREFLTYQEKTIRLVFAMHPLPSEQYERQSVQREVTHILDHFRKWNMRDVHLLLEERKGIHSLSRRDSLHQTYLAEVITAESLNADALQEYASSRTLAHLHRLARPLKQMYGRRYDSKLDSHDEEIKVSHEKLQNNVCEEFSRDFLGYLAKRPRETATEVWHQVRETIGYEGPGVFFFWTVAPYVHHCQRQAGISQEESIDKIFSWIKKSSANYFFHSQHLISSENAILAPDQRMPSHFQAHLVARYLLTDSQFSA